MRGGRAQTLVGLVLLVLGILALVYGGFSYTEESHDASLGPIDFEVKERERVEVPQWVGVALVVVGALLLVAGRR